MEREIKYKRNEEYIDYSNLNHDQERNQSK